MKKDVLTRPFPPELIRQRQGQGGKTLSYVETNAVVRRLLEGCDQFDLSIVQHHILEDEVVVLARLTADGVTKEAFGGAGITRERDGRPVSIADDLKAAGSDALKKAASLLGVGLDLYSSASESHRVAQPEGRRTGEERRHPAAGPADRLTSRQYSALQAVARRQNLSRARFTELLRERFKKTDVNALTRREASSLLDVLTASNDAAH